MRSQIDAPTSTAWPGCRGSGIENFREPTLAPRVETYLSSNVFVTKRRRREDLPTAMSPARQIFTESAESPRRSPEGICDETAGTCHKAFPPRIRRGNVPPRQFRVGHPVPRLPVPPEMVIEIPRVRGEARPVPPGRRVDPLGCRAGLPHAR